MEKITLHDKVFRPYITNQELSADIDAVAARINADFEGCDDVPLVLCVLNGSIMFTADLLKRLNFPLELNSIKMSSYVGTESTGEVKVTMGLTASLVGRRVIIVEDIVESGYTMEALKKMLEGKGASKTYIATMLFKPEMLKVKDLKVDYVARNIANDFVVGYGLDYNELGRNLKDIYILDK
ncbi:MAG: hypoxanthine phosphoribosyltransferase [Bacteroidales bacterium]|nr:hypoxanthine phosphoribosyltransferase [Candidatus Cryptobacteroides caccocaballi]